MASVINLELNERQVTGKKVKHLRKQGLVPAVIHDHGKSSLIVQGDEKNLLAVYRQAGKHHPVIVKLANKDYTVMIKDAEFEPVKQKLAHIVFNSVNANQLVEAEVPIEPQYTEGNESSPAERAGLIVLKHLEFVEVEALPNNIPDVLYYPAEQLVEVGDNLVVADIKLPQGVTLKTDPHQSVASVYEPSALAAANDAIAGDSEETAITENTEEETSENDQPPAEQ